MSLDRLEALLQRFSMNTRLFHSGVLCGSIDFGESDQCGYLHLVRRGPLEVRHRQESTIQIDQPTLLMYPRPMGHQFICDELVGADLVCASVEFAGGAINPIANALPSIVVTPLNELTMLSTTLELLFSEASAQQCGRQSVINRLFEVVLIQLLRLAMQQGAVDNGMLAGLSHPQLQKALVAMHEDPAREWTLEALGDTAGMSRSSFANTFRDNVGQTPGDYLMAFRVSVAQDLLKRGRPLKHVATDVGYGSPVALSRAFKARTGMSPRDWLQSQA